jgi:hypothetical protein
MAQDARLLGMFSQELRGLAESFTAAQRTLAGRTRATATEDDHGTLESLLFRYVACRGSLVDMAGGYEAGRLAALPGTGEQTKGALLGLLARILIRYYDAALADLFLDDAFAGEKLNAAYPEADLPAGFLRTISGAAASIETREAHEAAWRLLTSELANPHSPIARVVERDPECGVLVRAIQALHPRLVEQGTRLATRQASRDPRFPTRTNPTRVAALTQRARAEAGSDLQAAVELDSRGIPQTIASWIADPLELTADQIAQVRSLVRPGDMVLTYRKGYLTNLFLPGKFKHGLTYIGEPAGRSAHAPAGSRYDLVEAVGDGVILNSLDFILGDQINRLAVVRPRLTDAERESALAKLNGYMGRP